MERLTKRENGHAHYPRCFEEPCVGMGCRIENCEFKVEICDRLANYEDTGLTPEEVSTLVKDWSDLCTIVGECGGVSRVRALVEANKDGRLVVLPSKTVWELTMDAGPDCDMKCPVDAFDEALGCDLCSKAKQFAYERPCTQELLKELGKTVFLTRQEAEAALAQEGGTNEDSGGL